MEFIMAEEGIKKVKKIFKIGLLEIVLTALITSLLTFIGSYFVMSSQLSKEQEYWSDRMKKERIQDLMNRQLNLFEEVNSDILLSEVMVKDYKIELAKFYSLYELAKYSPKIAKEVNANDVYNKGVEYHKHLNKLGAKLQMVALYFNEKVNSLIVPLSKALEDNYRNNALRDSSSQNQIGISKDYFNRDFETIKELSDNRINLIKAMRDNILELSNKLYNTN
jgi:hypothetical protein